jgi:hypothetical protein
MAGIHKKLLDFQGKYVSVKKTSQNSHQKNKYADINEIHETILPILTGLGILVSKTISAEGIMVELYDVEDDSAIGSFLGWETKGDPQKRGGEITYYSRYCLAAMLNLVQEDDDGVVASGNGNHAASGPSYEEKETVSMWLTVSRMSEPKESRTGKIYASVTTDKGQFAVGEKNFESIIDSLNTPIQVMVKDTYIMSLV